MNKKDQLGYDILERYNSEISEIKRRLNSIKEGNLYGRFAFNKCNGNRETNGRFIE